MIKLVLPSVIFPVLVGLSRAQYKKKKKNILRQPVPVLITSPILLNPCGVLDAKSYTQTGIFFL